MHIFCTFEVLVSAWLPYGARRAKNKDLTSNEYKMW